MSETDEARLRRFGIALNHAMPRHECSDEEKISVFDHLQARVTEIPYPGEVPTMSGKIVQLEPLTATMRKKATAIFLSWYGRDWETGVVNHYEVRLQLPLPLDPMSLTVCELDEAVPGTPHAIRVNNKPLPQSIEVAIIKAYREVAKHHIPEEAPDGMRCRLLVEFRLGDVRALDRIMPQ